MRVSCDWLASSAAVGSVGEASAPLIAAASMLFKIENWILVHKS